MSKKRTKKSTNTVTYGAELKQVVLELKDHFKGDRSNTARFVRDVHRFGQDSGVLTRGQLRVLGYIYKRNINNNKYVHHDWAIWQ